MVRQLSHELCQAHRLLSELGVKAIDGRRIYRYRFRHNLYREYLYQRLGEIDRSWMHAQVGAALEELYAGRAHEIASQLGWHYHQAGETSKAITYLEAAGDQAQQHYAYAEAIKHYLAAVELIKESGEIEQASRTLLKLGMAYHANLEFERSRQAYAEGFRLWHLTYSSKSSFSFTPAKHPLRLTWLVPDQLNIISDDRVSTIIIYNQLFCGLVSYHSDMGVIPDGAESWEIQDNGLRYIFHLREDAIWSDGAPVTADDYVLAWKRALDPSLQPVNANLLYDLKGARAYHQGWGSSDDVGVRAIDRFTLQVELEQPAGYFLHLLAYAPTFPVPEHILQSFGEAWVQPGLIVTNGAFRIEEWRTNERMILSRNPGYQSQYRGNVERVEVIDIPDIYEVIKEFEADHLDLVAYPYFAHQMELINDLKVRHTLEFFQIHDQGVTVIIFNSQVKPFNDLRVRQAFVQAIDKSTIIKTNYTTAMFIPAMGGLIPPSLAGHSPEIALKYDRNRAQGLLAEAGYPGGKGFPKAAIVTGDFPSRRLAVDLLVEQWREVLGLEIEKVFYDLSRPFGDRDALKDGLSMAFASIIPDYPDGDYYLRCFEEVYVRKTTGWRDKTYDQLLQAARLEHNPPRRLKYYQQADQLIIEQAIVAPFYYSTTPYLAKPWVKQRFTDFKNQLWKDLIIEPH
jgi:oligopeptide transport system substrate-binding protein